MNLLIAIMGDSYEKVKESERFEAARERARIIVDTEKRFPKSHRYHRFMHFVEAADASGKSKEVVWEGVTRRVTEIVTTRTDQVKSEMNSKLELLDSKLELLDNKLDGKLQMILNRLQ